MATISREEVEADIKRMKEHLPKMRNNVMKDLYKKHISSLKQILADSK